MCWNSRNAIAKIADNDIECFKIVLLYRHNTICSYYQEFKYELNKLYKTELNVTKYRSGFTSILQGFHSYSNELEYDIITYNMIPLIKVFNNKTNNILQSYIIHSTLSNKNILTKTVIANCIIPKGSVYYINKSEEIVSDQLIIKSIKEL